MSFFVIQLEAHAEVMVDLETMGTKPGSPILSIGAVLFNPYEQSSYDELFEKSFLRTVEFKSAIEHSTGISPDTLKWWFEQSDTAIKRLVSADAIPLAKALEDFEFYCTNRSARSPLPPKFHGIPIPKYIWAKDPDFDCAILEDKFERFGRPFPFRYGDRGAVRTAQRMAFPDPNERPVFASGVAHDARDDAIGQALMIQACFMQIGLHPTQSVTDLACVTNSNLPVTHLTP